MLLALPMSLLVLCAVGGAHGLSALFIGNSYTYYHDMPKTVQQLAASAGYLLDYEQSTPPSWTWKLVRM